jgi:hypothetical protein
MGSPRSFFLLDVVLFATKKFKKQEKAKGVEEEEEERREAFYYNHDNFLHFAPSFSFFRLLSSFGHVRKPRLRLRVVKRMFIASRLRSTQRARI